MACRTLPTILHFSSLSSDAAGLLGENVFARPELLVDRALKLAADFLGELLELLRIAQDFLVEKRSIDRREKLDFPFRRKRNQHQRQRDPQPLDVLS